MADMKYTISSVQEMEFFAKKFLGGISASASGKKGATVVGLYGDLGSGKTTFTQAVARILGMQETVTSPTFVIEKIYPLEGHAFSKHLIHIDAYRLEKSEELVRLGWNEIIADQDNLILIEWPEKVADIMPTKHIKLKFTFINETTREIEWQ